MKVLSSEKVPCRRNSMCRGLKLNNPELFLLHMEDWNEASLFLGEWCEEEESEVEDMPLSESVAGLLAVLCEIGRESPLRAHETPAKGASK